MARNSVELVALTIRDLVVRAELSPGEHVRQTYWADRLGVSRVPVREAFKMLESEGILLHEPERGYFVAKLLSSDLEQVYEIREFLEPKILGSIRWPSSDELALLSEMAERSNRAAVQGDLGQAVSEDQQFFFAIYDLSPLSFMVSEVKRLWSLADPFRIAVFSTLHILDPEGNRLRAGHDQILKALAEHDRESIVTWILENRKRKRHYIDNEPHGDLFSALTSEEL